MPPERKKSGLLLLLSTPGSYKATTVGETYWNDAIIVRIISQELDVIGRGPSRCILALRRRFDISHDTLIYGPYRVTLS
jgi:hypothetical protein